MDFHQHVVITDFWQGHIFKNEAIEFAVRFRENPSFHGWGYAGHGCEMLVVYVEAACV